MKRLLTLAIAASLTIALVPLASAAKKPKQVVEGSIAVPQGGGPAATCVYRAQRSIIATAGQPNGIVGYTFDVDPATVGKKFKLTPSDGAGIDISFYSELGDPTNPTAAPTNVPFENVGPGGEKGVVPEGFPIAFVCLTDGANATFTYKAG